MPSSTKPACSRGPARPSRSRRRRRTRTSSSRRSTSTHAKDRTALFAELDRALKLPEHFGHNWDALADVLEDRDWLGKSGRVILFAGSNAYRSVHPTDWTTLEDIFAEASEFWKERHLAFWIFTA